MEKLVGGEPIVWNTSIQSAIP